MRSCRRTALLVALLAVFSASTVAATAPPHGVPQKKTTVYASQGQAVYRYEERSKSQKQAVHAFLTHGVAQAITSIVGSSQMNAGSQAAKERILKQPERYVESYRITSEGPSKGIYKVAGEVTVGIQAIKKELSTAAVNPASASPASTKPPPLGGEQANPAPTTSKTAQTQPPPSRGVIFSKPSLFWAVSEKWDNQWILPVMEAGQQVLFARNLLQESEDFEWTLRFPEQSGINIDAEGNASVDQVTALARQAGAKHAVVGTVALVPSRSQAQELVVAANLRLLDVDAGKLLGDMHKEASAESGSIQEAVMNLADSVALQLDRTFQSEQAPPEKSQAAARRSAPTRPTDGSWALNIRGENHYAAWEELLKALRERFADMHIQSVDVGGDETRAVVDGIEEAFFSSLEKAPLPRGLQMRVESLSSESRQIELSVQSRTAVGGPHPEPQP
jgi:hypothetical protein